MARRGASTAGAAAGGGPDGAGTEQVDQQITATLRAIDGDFVKAADLAASMLGDVRTFTANMKATHAGLQVWKQFFMGLASAPRSGDDADADGDHDMARTPSKGEPGARNQSDVSVSMGSPPISTPFYKPSKTPGRETDARMRRREAAAAAGAGGGDSGSSLGTNLFPALSPPLTTTFHGASSILSDISRRSEGDSFAGAGGGAHTPATAPRHGSTPASTGMRGRMMMTPATAPRRSKDDSGASTPSFASPPHTVTVQRSVPWAARLDATTPGSTASSDAGATGAQPSPALVQAAAQAGARTPATKRARAQAWQTPASADDSAASSPTFRSPPVSSTPIPARALHPTTPISNRIAAPHAASFTSNDNEYLLEELEASAHDPPPTFDLSLFPPIFRTGAGAVQLSQVYSRFQQEGDVALSLAQLAEDLPDLGTGKISLLLETLVSRRFLRPFIVDDEMFWRMTASAAK